jgi:RNA polymerase sigma factor (sigma-70 family)
LTHALPIAVDEIRLPGDRLSNDEVAEIHRRYGYFLRRRCRQILRDPVAADDALQELFVKIMGHGAPLRTMEHPLGWMYRVADRCCLDHLRRHRRLQQHAPLSDDPCDPGPQPGVRAEVRDAVLKVLADLDDRERQVALMAFLDGMSQSEISLAVGWSRVTVNKKIQSIRERAERVLAGPHG